MEKIDNSKTSSVLTKLCSFSDLSGIKAISGLKDPISPKALSKFLESRDSRITKTCPQCREYKSIICFYLGDYCINCVNKSE